MSYVKTWPPGYKTSIDSHPFLEENRVAVKKTQQLTVVIEREGNGYVSLCPELDIASQGDSVNEARENLIEAVELFFESASPTEIKERLHPEVYVSQIEVAVG